MIIAPLGARQQQRALLKQAWTSQATGAIASSFTSAAFGGPREVACFSRLGAPALHPIPRSSSSNAAAVVPFSRSLGHIRQRQRHFHAVHHGTMADDAALEKLEGGARAPRGGGKGKRGGGAPDREVLISKALSALLRHKASDAGIDLDGEGFARLDQVLQWNRLKSLKPSLAEIQKVERDNAKKRFTLKPAAGADDSATDPRDWLIRANQGHSIEIASEALHTPLTLEAANVPAVVVHGTYFAFWPAIVAAGGLKKMGRTHVHFGTGLPDGDGAPVHSAVDEEKATEADAQPPPPPKVISGMRADAEVLVFVDVEASLRNGDMAWWLSSNGVVLTEGDADGVVPLKYLREVRGRRQGVGLLWKDGQHVADLPDGLHVRVPQGKDRQGGRGGRGRGRGR